MAQPGSPNASSPLMAARPGPAQNTGPPSPSPPSQPLPQTKRDKRRTMLTERLNSMIANFSSQHQIHYYAQLSAVQCDINLVMRADPYTTGPLEDSPESISNQVAEARDEICRSRGRQIDPEAEESFRALGGKTYSAFVDEVNGALEERDRDLTMLSNEYNDALSELRKTNQYKIQLAQEEHALLSKTLRDRLLQSVSQKKSKLMRDKEQLDIADSSALLLNPNQFSLANPSSPSGAHSNRKTRHTRLRPGDGDDITTTATTGIEGNKRKRKAAFDENENDSSGPSGKNGENWILSAYRNGRQKTMHSQFEAPLFSIERLFTEKDLAMNMNKAHKATFAYFNRLKTQQNGASHDAATAAAASGDSAAKSQEGAASAEAVNGDAPDGENADAEAAMFNPSPSLLNYLPRTSSQTYHATRSQRNTGLEVLSAAATGMTPFAASLSATASKSNPQAPPPAALDETYIQEDLELMELPADNSDMKILQKRSLEKASLLSLGLGLEGGAKNDTTAKSAAGPNTTINSAGIAPTSAPGQAAATSTSNVGSVPMTKTTSMGGIQDFASATSAPMTRSASTRT